MRSIQGLREVFTAIYESLRFKFKLHRELSENTKESYRIRVQSNFTYADIELIIYDIQSVTSLNIFYVLLPLSTKHTRIVAHVDQDGTVETCSFYGAQLHKTIAKFMLAKFGEI